MTWYEVWIYRPGYDEDAFFLVQASNKAEAERIGREESRHHRRGYKFMMVVEREGI